MLVIDGLKRIINSAKVQTTAAAAFGAWVTYATSDGTPAEKAPLKLALIIAVGTLVGIVLVSWAAEDFAKHRAEAPAKPSTQVNVQSDVSNPTPVAVAGDAMPAPAPKPVAAPKPAAKPSAVDLLVAAVNKLSEKIDNLPTATKPGMWSMTTTTTPAPTPDQPA
jgi:hypothetical protein